MGSVTFLTGQDEDAMRATARKWLLEIAENPSAQELADEWRAADPAHERAWREASSVWVPATHLGLLNRTDWRAEMEVATRPGVRRYAPWMAAAAAMVALLPGIAHFLDKPDLQTATHVAEIRQLALADGSQVTLGAKSGLEVRFEPASRRVVLDHGQAFFEVAHDTGRPFTVVAGGAEIRVTGTKFDVRRVGDDIQVGVLEGRVELRRRGRWAIFTPNKPDRVLTAGFKAELFPGAGTFSSEEKVQIAPGEWRNGRLYYSEAPLSEILTDLQRYSLVPLRIEDPAVANLKVTTSFRASQVPSFLANLAATLPIRQRRAVDGAIVIEAHAASF